MPNTARNTLIKELSYKPAQRLGIFRELSIEEQASVITKVTRYLRKDIVSKLDNEELQRIIQQLDPVNATDILQLISARRRKEIVAELTEELRRDVSVLLSFDPDTAASIMNLEYIQVPETDTIGAIAENVQLHEKRTGKVPTILIKNATGLHNFLPIYKLALAKPHEKVAEHSKRIATLKHTSSQKEVLNFFRTHPHNKAVVIGEHDNVLGVIYSDDVLRMIRDQESSSLYDFAGVKDEETVFDSLKRKVQSRYKWLILNLGTAFLAAFTVGFFDAVISKEVLLAVYMPIVAGMGGNAGTQTLAVMVRGLGQHELTKKEVLMVLRNEVGAGLINGLINGCIVFAAVVLINQHVLVAAVLAIAMVFNLLVSSTFGTLVPVVMNKLGKDPASSATIFITTATDIFGFFAFLGLATLLLQ